MKHRSRCTQLVVTILLVLSLSAMWTVPVLADDATPPPPAATEVVPVEEHAEQPATTVDQAPVDAAVTEEVTVSAPTPEPPVTDGKAAVEKHTSHTSHTQKNTQLLAQVPDNTDIAVLDQSGNPVPLASQEAAYLLQTGDPIWCPLGAAPIAGVGGCTSTQPTLLALINGFLGNTLTDPKTNGVIWITGGADASGSAILIDGANPNLGTGLTAWRNFSLTLNGGWTGTSAGAMNVANPSQFNRALSIVNWNGNITLNNIVVNGATGLGYALAAETTKNITVTNVEVGANSTHDGGALLNNTAGLGNVVVNDSTFNGNTGATATGLVVYSKGIITIKNLTANTNTENGAWLDNRAATLAKGVTLIGSNNFMFNSNADGLAVYSQGAITLSNVTAIYNGNLGTQGGNGAYLDNCDYDSVNGICNQNFTAAVILKGSNNFSSNGLDGLAVNGSGAIIASNLTANNNGGFNGAGDGAFLNNFGAFTHQPLTLTGVNAFNGNAGAGLWVDSYGAVTLNNVTANENGFGANCSGNDCDGLRVDDSNSFLLAGYGVFNSNSDDGFEGYSWGFMTLNNLYAEGNGSWGTYLDNTLKPVFDPGSGQIIFVNAGVPVNLIGINTFSSNGGSGLEVLSSGVITTNAVTAVSNNGDGVYLDNCQADSNDACTGLLGKAVTMNGTNNIYYNGGNGIWLQSSGAIKVSNLTSSGNAGYGAILDNNWGHALGGVTIAGFANTSENGVSGLGIFSTGTVLTSNLTANLNGPSSAASGEVFYRGVYIYNASGLGNVTLLGINQFNDNWNTGLRILSKGIVTLNSITATYNGQPGSGSNPTPEGFGVYVDNCILVSGACTTPTPKAVILNGVNIFNNNLDDGLDIISKGAITVSKPTALNNTGGGLYLDNQWGVAAAPVTIAGYGTFNGNSGGLGLEVYSNGNITLSNITAVFNGGSTPNGNVGGVYLDNFRFAPAGLPVNVTLLGVNTFNDNGTGDGLRIFSDGLITLNNITANNNAGNGAFLNNFDYRKALNPRNIVLNGSNTFVNNSLNGLQFTGSGAVILTRINADVNGTNGVFGSATSSLTLTCGSLNFNGSAGYNLTAGTALTLKGVFSYLNGSSDVATAPIKSITRTCPLP